MLPRISELNAYVPVRDLGGLAGQEITVDLIQPFQVRTYMLFLHVKDNKYQAIVLCNVSYKKQLEINDWTHRNGVHFIAAETRGLFG
jgi:ubiquitin-activating enzyme E1